MKKKCWLILSTWIYAYENAEPPGVMAPAFSPSLWEAERQWDLCECQDSLVSTVSSKPVRAPH